MRRLIMTTAASVILVGQLLTGISPAQADASNGLCGRGAALASYTTTVPAYNGAGLHMWTIYYTKRWCYVYSKHAVTSWSARFSVEFYSGFGIVWLDSGLNTSDAYYSSVNARGRATSYPRYGHVSWVKLHLKHCAIGILNWICDDKYYRVGIQAFSDGSKKLA